MSEEEKRLNNRGDFDSIGHDRGEFTDEEIARGRSHSSGLNPGPFNRLQSFS